MADKIDFKKTLESYQATRGEFRVVDVPEMQYLMIDGHGDPNASPAYAEALAALYPVAYKLKFASKRALGRDYVVPPLEGLWWAEGFVMEGKHHEIYFSDFRKVAPERLRTILRQPVQTNR